MTTRDKHIAQKKKEIEKIERQQARLENQAIKIATMPYKRPATYMRRVPRFLDIYARVKSLEVEKQIIMSMPLPKSEIGGVITGNMAVFKESGPEVIAAGNFKIYPTSFVKPDTVLVISEGGIIDERVFKALKK